MAGRSRTFKGRPRANELAKFLCGITEGKTLRELSKLVPDASTATWGNHLNGSVLIPKPRLRLLLTALAAGDAIRLERYTLQANPLWKAADSESRISPSEGAQGSSETAVLHLQEKLIVALDGQRRAEVAAEKAHATVKTLRQMGAVLESLISSTGSQLQLSLEGRRTELELQLAQARQRLQRTQSELDKAQQRRYTAEMAQQALLLEVLDAQRQIARLEQKVEDVQLPELPRTARIIEPPSAVLLEAIDDKLDGIAQEGAEEDEELAGLAEQAHLGSVDPRATDNTVTISGDVVDHDENPDDPEADPLSKTFMDNATTRTDSSTEDGVQPVEGQIPERSDRPRPDQERAASEAEPPRTTGAPTADEAFEARYRDYVTRRHEQMTIYGVDVGYERHSRWSLDLAYMSLEVAGTEPPSATERVEQALSGRQRTVIQGTPGSGKTTLLQWLAVNAARGTLPSLLGHLNGSVPFLVSLRSLARHAILPGPDELLTAIDCPLSGTEPKGWASRVFDRGRALVLVDGVDEMPAAQQGRLQGWLEALLAAHPHGCYVVTTRALTVPEDWLNSVGFRHLTLQQMRGNEVAVSISLWHAAARLDADEQERRVLDELERTLQETVRRDPNLAALATTPLLCALICVLHRDRRGLLPTSMMSLYAAALSMLLGRRDAERYITDGIVITESESMQLLQTMAIWLIRNGQSDTHTARAEQLLDRVLPAMPRVSEQGGTERILQHLLIRSGLLREPAAGRVQFIHRTFQDYLGARAAVEDDALNELVGMAHQEEWENVVRMATGHARPRERGELLSSLVHRGDKEEHHREQLHRLAASCLEYAPELAPEVRDIIHQRMPDGSS
ncbi:NACHT domain-containing protein [Streptomyces sp. NPDC002120]|uniref:NACHT domain-containing protein n=1 Tax=Streptomyces sp. NPDC002120 TaxID=3364631 RepID=UPI0036C63026